MPAERTRSTFGPVVLLGLASTGLAAVASNQTWATATPTQGGAAYATTYSGAQVPLALSLALVALAGWGVLLVLRGRPRRIVAWLTALAASGLVVTVVVGRVRLPAALARDASVPVEVTGRAWFWVALVMSVLATAAAVAAVRTVRTWPEMGSRYDAPGATEAPAEPETPLEIWRAIDEGRDPTA